MNEEIKPQHTNCKYFVKRKKRFCKMTVRQGFEYCGEHMPNSEDSKNEKTLRIVCPLDKKHTCFAHKLEQHLKVCNARPVSVAYIVKDINCRDKTLKNAFTRQLSSVKAEDLKVLIEKIDKIYADNIEGNILNNYGKDPIVEKEIEKPEYGNQTKRQLIQASSIIGLLNSNQLINDDTCYIEFGAGKGRLSYWVSQTIKEKSNSAVLLVERASHRHKQDNKLEKNNSYRIKADIGDLVLKEIEVLKRFKSVVAVAKHLCGDATDLAFECLKSFMDFEGKVDGIIMAFCCHHRCQWSSYVGKNFFNECGLNCKDFDAICGMVSWAICGTGLSRGKTITSNNAHLNDRDTTIGLNRDDKEVIGLKCKRILDWGRLLYLKDNYFTNCNLNYYVSCETTPENVCIVALK